MKGDTPTDSTEMQRIIIDYYEYQNANNLDNLEKMDKFLETEHLPRLNHEETENIKRSVMNKEIQLVIKNLPRRKAPASSL